VDRAAIAAMIRRSPEKENGEMRFEDAVTKDGGPFHLPWPDPVRSLFGGATARCHE
jgi:hypothetical protein